MKPVFLLLLGTLPLFAQTAPVPAPAPAQAPPPDLPAAREFTNLPEETRTKFTKHLIEASKYFQQKRIFETLDETAKAAKIFGDSPALLNLQGACYVEFRDFEKARACFAKANQLQPGVGSVLFNIAEVEFCAQQWQVAHDRFTELLPKIPEKDLAMRRLVEFKILLCKIKLGGLDEARKLAGKYDFLDDSPYHYYANAVIEFQQNNLVKAEEWLAIAGRIFRDPNILSPWQDTLIEFGYIKSFYGGDEAEE
jgi:tetratricopeptide (TPR) repeat protein